MLPSIPVSHFVSINPAALSAGGSSLGLNTVLLSDTSRYPIREYSSPASVASVFGFESPEYKFAQTYFNGYVGGTLMPSTLFIARYNDVDKKAQLIGRGLSSMSLEELKGLSGDIKLVVDGTQVTIENTSLADVSSFSDAAQKLSDALSSGASVEFDTRLQAFVIQSISAGDGSSVSYATGELAESLGLTQNGGATVDNAVLADSANTVMDKVTNYTLNFAVITTVGDSFSIDTDKAIALWNSKQNSRFWFVQYGREYNALIANNTTCFGAYLKELEIDGTTAIYGDLEHAALACAFAGSINFSMREGRATMEFKRQAGLAASVTDKEDANSLESNGYAYYGAFGTANDRFIFFKNTRVSGEFAWVDPYLNQVYFNSQLQLAFVNMLMSYQSVPYNEDGEAMHRAAAQDPVDEMINFGGIRKGIALSNAQRNQANFEAGFDVATQIKNNGYFLWLGEATAQTRAARASLPARLWYTDGGSVHAINLASINIQ
ncbi:hypothetical protein AAEX37_01956 [Oligella sp. MSHR50489EDL]|uniref:DUF3383 domain-containing protein n=1 Tax=Oligella sp. MSHR50489EDL TaxID=3139409 RepID=UPI003D81BBC0